MQACGSPCWCFTHPPCGKLAWLGLRAGSVLREGPPPLCPNQLGKRALRTLPALDELRDLPSWLHPAAARAQLPYPKKEGMAPGTDVANVP